MTRKVFPLAAAIFLLGAPAFGDVLTLTFDPFLEAGPPGGSVIFQGTIASNVDDYCCLNSITASFGSPGDTYLSIAPNFFSDNVFGILFAPDDNYIGPILEVLIAPDTPAGLYSGTATILGGVDDFSALDPLVSQNFQVEVTPEPGMEGLTLAGLATMAAIALRRRIR